VVMCSITTFSFWYLSTSSGPITRSMNSASRSKTSTSASVTSPWTIRGTPSSSIALSVGSSPARSVTPESELVVAPAG